MAIEAEAMIGSGASGTFANKAFAQANRILMVTKEKSRTIKMIDGTPISGSKAGGVSEETTELKIIMGTYSGITNFDFDGEPLIFLILGATWLEKSNPIIN